MVLRSFSRHISCAQYMDLPGLDLCGFGRLFSSSLQINFNEAQLLIQLLGVPRLSFVLRLLTGLIVQS